MVEETKDRAIGIDLGTTFSAMAVWDPKAKETRIIENAEGHRTTPSMVCFTKGKKVTDLAQVLVGSTAMNLAPRNAENCIYDSKRMVGAMFHDQAVQKDLGRWPFKVVENK